MSAKSSLLRALWPHHRLVAVACYCVGFLWVCVFPSFDRRTELEEHALNAGYSMSGLDAAWGSKLRALARKIEGADANETVLTSLQNALTDADLIYHQVNFTTAGRQNSTALYTTASAMRADSREAVVVLITTNWTRKRSSWGLSVGVVLAQYLSSVQWLSKDVFVVFVDKALPYGAGARGWLSAYFGGSSAVRRGVLRQAIVLDTPSRPVALHFDVEGINGALPNQDIVNAFEREGLPMQNRGVWDSVRFTFGNGGVHSNHAAFLEFQVPSFTVRGTVGSQGRPPGGHLKLEDIARGFEGIVRCTSNVLQQLHHSFNFYFYTSHRRHISNGLYLYPVYLMQMPIVSFLCMGRAYRDIRSFLVGLGATVSTVLVAGSPLFLLATEGSLVAWLGTVVPFSLHPPPACENAFKRGEEAREAVLSWLAAGAVAAFLLALVLRRYAYSVFHESKGDGDDTFAEDRNAPASVQLPTPLWEAVHGASGFYLAMTLAPLAIYSWAVAMPLTIVTVPFMVLARPWSMRWRPLRTLLLLLFLGLNAVLLAAPAARRSVLVGEPALHARSVVVDFYFRTALPAMPQLVRPWLPTHLMSWLQNGGLDLPDMPQAIFESARDFNCVGGMIFPVFCFIYWPFLVLLALIAFLLPAQRVEDESFTLQQVRLMAVFFTALFIGSGLGGVMWRSYSSAGLGQLQW